jgi:hypothetical protein
MGILGNMVASMIFIGKAKQMQQYVLFLIALNISDSAYLITHLTLTVFARKGITMTLDTLQLIIRVENYLETLFGTMSLWYIFALTIIRVIMITRSKQLTLTNKFKNRTNILKIILGIPVVFVILYSFQIIEIKDTRGKSAVAFVAIKALSVITLRMIPAILTIACNCVIVVNLKNQKINRRRLTPQQESSANVTRTLIGASCVLATLCAPITAVYILIWAKVMQLPCEVMIVHANAGMTEVSTITEGIYQSACLTYDFHYASNFIVYYISGREFRQCFLSLFCKFLNNIGGQSQEIAVEEDVTGEFIFSSQHPTKICEIINGEIVYSTETRNKNSK